MSQKIKSISEAFSMQPTTYGVGRPVDWTKGISDKNPAVMKIVLENKVSGPGLVEFLVGYDENEKPLFEFLRLGFNIIYF